MARALPPYRVNLGPLVCLAASLISDWMAWATVSLAGPLPPARLQRPAAHELSEKKAKLKAPGGVLVSSGTLTPGGAGSLPTSNRYIELVDVFPPSWWDSASLMPVGRPPTAHPIAPLGSRAMA